MSLVRTDELPSDSWVLFRDYPRDAWEQHPGFKQRTINWLSAHQSFLQLAGLLCSDAEALLDGKMHGRQYRGRLSYLGSRMLGNLHAHHGWEDREYFPELSAADSRFNSALAILEQDHRNLDNALDSLNQLGNTVLRTEQDYPERLLTAVGNLYPNLLTIKALLERHLKDEEEIAVPIILHYRLRG